MAAATVLEVMHPQAELELVADSRVDAVGPDDEVGPKARAVLEHELAFARGVRDRRIGHDLRPCPRGRIGERAVELGS